MEINALEAEAKAKAVKHVANVLHAPDKLEKIDQMKFNVERKKASVEAMLKTAMQSQLDGVKTGLTKLEEAMRDVQEVRQCLLEMERELEELPPLLDDLDDVRAESLKHSQLATAKENLRHIFTVPETVAAAEVQITEGRLLEAHKALAELENSRDDLLFELHKLPHKNTADRDMLKEYFEPVGALSDLMEKHLKFTLRRTLNTVRKDPKVLVTALRVIEREEKLDAECAQRQKVTGFLPPGRPKRWRHKTMAVLKTNVQERVEGNQLEQRTEDKMWLVRHLELIRMITLEDLRVAKSLCRPVFPPSYHILDHFLDLYHEALKTRLLEIVQSGLEGQEYVTVLSWIIQTYPGKELMGDPSLGIPAAKIKPLLGKETIAGLEQEYLENMHTNYVSWMQKTLAQDVEDWTRETDPDLDNDDRFHTSAPIIVYQMIDENLQVAQTISSELVNKVFVLSVGEVCKYGDMYRKAIVDYKTAYFKDRSKVSMFTKYMIAIVNNCERFIELGQELKERWWKPGHHDSDASAKFETLLKTYKALLEESCGYLLEESFMDIEVQFSELLSSRWQNTTDAVDTVCATLDDYFQDYNYLKPNNFKKVISLAQDRIAKRYITSMLQNNILRRKITFESAEDRRKAAAKIEVEAAQCKRLFRRVAPDAADFDSPFDVLTVLAEVLKSDQEMLSLHIGILVQRYSDVQHEQLLCLLALRGDLERAEARAIASEFVPTDGGERMSGSTTLRARSILSQVQVSSSLNPFAEGGVSERLKNPFA